MFARRVTTAGRKATDPDRKAKGFTVTASVSNRLGGVFANRGAYCLNPAGLFSLEPAELVVTTNPNLHEDHVRALKAAAEEGMAGVVAYLVAKGLVLNASTEDIGQVTDWVEAFPGAGRVRRQHLGSGIYRFEACFTADSAEFMVTADYARNHPAKLAILKDISQSIFEIPEPAASGSGPACR